MLRITQLKLKEGHSPEAIEKKLRQMLGISPGDFLTFTIRKKSLDARKKPELFFVYTVDFTVKNEEKIKKKLKNKVQEVTEKAYVLPQILPQKGEKLVTQSPYVPSSPTLCPLAHRPVIAGSGPAGLFCAYLLAQAGFAPLVLERGACMAERVEDVKRFWETGILDTQSNVQFGEGGAGTFSDGKLNTLVKDPIGRNRYVLETFVKFGAPQDILYEQKPHIGTDILSEVVVNMRRAIEKLGGTFLFRYQLTDIDTAGRRIQINHEEWMEAEVLILALGHSARDTFRMLYERNLHMEAKSFAVGVRVEHPQKVIDTSQYGREDRRGLAAASYKLTEKLSNGRGVYSFCMCPGGYVVNASSEEGHLAVNGMSYHGRAGENANSAIIVTVTPEDFKQFARDNAQDEKDNPCVSSLHPLSGIAFQRDLEKRAWQAGEGKIPVQRYEDFCAQRPSTETGKVRPNLKGAYTLGDVRQIFPEKLSASLEEGIRRMDKKIHGFADGDTLLSGVESRTSSPVRIPRDEQFVSSIPWIYPCGEGAGYAGGITSAAMDGMKVAEAVIRHFALEFSPRHP